jgi:hypothetical protein
MKKLILILIALLSPTAWAVNSFAGDPNCISVYYLESAAFTTDSIGTNTLTNKGADANGVYYKQGTGSGRFVVANADDMNRPDASLSSKFPLKNGTTNYEYTVTCWARLATINGGTVNVLWSKGKTSFSTGTGLQVYATNYLQFSMQFAKGPFTLQPVSAPLTGRWYYLVCSYNNTTYKMHFYIWDDTAGSVIYDVTSADLSPSGAPVCSTNRWMLGGSDAAAPGAKYDGVLDEVTVWNRALSGADIIKIRDGTYTYATTTLRAHVLHLIEN